ncbi:MAG: methylmalonyl-CoA mutase family protein, partial [Myxococcota bacterium]
MNSPTSIAPYAAERPIRLVTAASLFDGHDAAINIMRRILQASGAEVIHLGHNRSVAEVVRCAIQEDAQGIAMTSYQGGHVEYFKYMVDLLREAGSKAKIFGGGGGTILPSEIDELHAYGVARIFSPDDGRDLGLQGMINLVLEGCDFATVEPDEVQPLLKTLEGAPDERALGRIITLCENHPGLGEAVRAASKATGRHAPVLGITGTGGAGKSSLVDELVRRFLLGASDDQRIAILSVDPSKRRTGGALLGDRIRMNAIDDPRVYMRSLATRQSNLALSKHVGDAVALCRAAGFDLVIVETSGIGQSDTEIVEHSDVSLYVMTADYGAATQLEKIDMLDFADVIAINKFDKRGSLDAIRDVRKQYKRNHMRFDASDDELPIHGTIASQFSDPGTDRLYDAVAGVLAEKAKADVPRPEVRGGSESLRSIVPPDRVRYLAEIAEESDRYDQFVDAQSEAATRLFQLAGAIAELRGQPAPDAPVAAEPKEGDDEAITALLKRYEHVRGRLDGECRSALEAWPERLASYAGETYSYEVRGRTLSQPLRIETLAGLQVPRVVLPRDKDWGAILRWILTENAPGSFPYAAGVFPLKRQGEDPARMFAGEGGPERTNRRFHYVSRGMPARRLSTAFDSVTLYGENPDHRPDIFGKIGNSGVSVCSVDDAKKLYSGFDLADPATSVSMTINGPAPMLLAFFLRAAVDQQCEKVLREAGRADEVRAAIDTSYRDAGLEAPRYQGDLPEGNDG